VIDHHLLGVHHVRSGDNETLYDLAFLGLGALLVGAGLLLARRPGLRPAAGRRDPA
jgi:LPXTG-motif cell wall-anchored protein